MINQIRKLTEQYHNWVRESTTLQMVENAVEITTPFLDRHNDMLQVYAALNGDEILLTDDGYTIEDLEFCGVTVDSARSQNLMQVSLNGFGVQRKGNDLVIRATAEDFAWKLHNLLQAMIAVDDLAHLATPSDISEQYDGAILYWLAVAEICFGAKTLKGTSGYEVDYKFVIPPSGNMPHRFVVGIAYPKRSTVEQAAFRWLDCRDHRPDDARLYPILNDLERDEALEAADALRNFNINPVLWSDRDSILPELAA